MNDLNKYYHLLFKEADKWNNYHFWTEIILVLILISSNFINMEVMSYAFAIVCLAIQIISFIFKNKQRDYETIAHKLQEYAMLYTTFRKNTFNFDVSQLKGVIHNNIHKKVSSQEQEPESADYLVDEESKNALLMMIQENAFWNHHLFSYCFRRSMMMLILPVTGVIVFILVAIIGQPHWEISKFFLPRILIGILTANVFFTQLETVIRFYNGSKEMLQLDNMIARDGGKGEDFWLHVFAKYNMAKTLTPLVKNSIYEKNKVKLNLAWKTRSIELYGKGTPAR